ENQDFWLFWLFWLFWSFWPPPLTPISELPSVTDRPVDGSIHRGKDICAASYAVKNSALPGTSRVNVAAVPRVIPKIPFFL
ncbi:hypothetical protein N9M16_09725, partial [Candidatus Dependentiae bacterium]|nr:hypothetical protein [Candidatus Dependentiae bacterium]